MSALSFMAVSARCVMPARRAMATRSAGRTTVVTKAGKCGCGKTDDKDGNCDGSHAKKMCGCGATASAKGFCDGSHAKLCKCGKTADPKKLCDGSHAK